MNRRIILHKCPKCEEDIMEDDYIKHLEKEIKWLLNLLAYRG